MSAPQAPEVGSSGLRRRNVPASASSQATPASQNAKKTLPTSTAPKNGWRKQVTFWRRVARSGSGAVGYGALLTVMVVFHSWLRLSTPRMYREVIDKVVPNKDLDALNRVILMMLAACAGKVFANYTKAELSARMGTRIRTALQRSMFARLQHVPVEVYYHTTYSELSLRLRQDASSASQFYTKTAVNVFGDVVALLMSCATMVRIDYRPVAACAVVWPLFFMAGRVLRKRYRKTVRAVRAKASSISTVFYESLQHDAAILTRTAGGQEHNLRRYEEAAAASSEAHIVMGQSLGMLMGVSGAFWSLAIAMTYYLGGRLAIRGDITAGNIVHLSIIIFHVMPLVRQLSDASQKFVKAAECFERVFEVLDMPVRERALPVGGVVVPEQVVGDVEFTNVCFAYPCNPLKVGLEAASRAAGTKADKAQADAQEPPREVLRDVSFTLRHGSSLGICGLTGSGKSTLANLLLRLFEPTSGSITLDGVPLSAYNPDSLPSLIAYLPQESFLFNSSIADNLRFGRPDATDEELAEACRAAKVADFVESRPKGYQHVVGPRGGSLSGGQRRRLCIARCLLQKAAVVVLDEPLSGLDAKTQAEVLEGISTLKEHSTVVIITHNLETLRAVDSALVIEAGRVVAEGGSAELLQRAGSLAQLLGARASSPEEPGKGSADA